MAAALGSCEVRRPGYAGQRRDRPSLQRRQRPRPRHVAARIRRRRSALVQLQAGERARVASAPGRTRHEIFFYKPLEIKDDSAPDREGAAKTIPILKTFTAFHASQIDGVPEFLRPSTPKPLAVRIEDADVILKNSGVIVRTGGDRAFYSPGTDHIQLPPDEAFHSPEEWAATALHELAHASGATHRLNRDLTGKFGSFSYSREELRAELASLFVGGELGIPTDIPNHASYIQSWVKVLKEDKREIFHAAADAQKISDYILAFHPDFSREEPLDPAEEDREPASVAEAA